MALGLTHAPAHLGRKDHLVLSDRRRRPPTVVKSLVSTIRLTWYVLLAVIPGLIFNVISFPESSLRCLQTTLVTVCFLLARHTNLVLAIATRPPLWRPPTVTSISDPPKLSLPVTLMECIIGSPPSNTKTALKQPLDDLASRTTDLL